MSRRRGLSGLIEREQWIADLLRDALISLRRGTLPRAEISLLGAKAELAYLTGPAPR